jgi:KTSC domain
MQRQPVSSSTVLSIGYDSASLTLEVEFSKGTVYQYFDVPQSAYEELLTAPSIGGYLNTMIKPNYRYTQL